MGLNEVPSQHQIFEDRLSACECRGDVTVVLSEELDDIYIIRLNAFPTKGETDFSFIEIGLSFGSSLVAIGGGVISHAELDSNIRYLRLVNGGDKTIGGGVYHKRSGVFTRASNLFGEPNPKTKRLISENIDKIK